jgi:tRNA (mo5U34)-methyltransferase
MFGRKKSMTAEEVEQIKAEAAKLNWYHCIELVPGFTTQGFSGLSAESPRWETDYIFPRLKELRGKSLLDIGTMNGFFAFQAEQRGATPVVAMDRDPPTFPDAREAFDLAARAMGSSVSYRALSVYDLDPSDPGTFDYVLFYGVLYHLKFPMYGLYRVANVCREVLLLETHVTVKDDYKWPLMLFYPAAELNDEATNWWGPNVRCVDALVEHLGFKVEQRVLHEQHVTGLEPARYTVKCRRVGPTPAFDDL